jgi:hypothetical protein
MRANSLRDSPLFDAPFSADRLIGQTAEFAFVAPPHVSSFETANGYRLNQQSNFDGWIGDINAAIAKANDIALRYKQI